MNAPRLIHHLLILLMYLCLHRVLDRGQAAHRQFAVSPRENCRPFDKCVFWFLQKHSGPASSHGLPSRCLPGPALSWTGAESVADRNMNSNTRPRWIVNLRLPLNLKMTDTCAYLDGEKMHSYKSNSAIHHNLTGIDQIQGPRSKGYVSANSGACRQIVAVWTANLWLITTKVTQRYLSSWTIIHGIRHIWMVPVLTGEVRLVGGGTGRSIYR